MKYLKSTRSRKKIQSTNRVCDNYNWKFSRTLFCAYQPGRNRKFPNKLPLRISIEPLSRRHSSSSGLVVGEFFFLPFHCRCTSAVDGKQRTEKWRKFDKKFSAFRGARVTMRMSFPLHWRCRSLIMMVGPAFETARVSEREICHSRPWPRLPGKKWVSRFVCAQWRARLLHCDRN